jgi:hypothetical protein
MMPVVPNRHTRLVEHLYVDVATTAVTNPAFGLFSAGTRPGHTVLDRFPDRYPIGRCQLPPANN